VENQLSAQKADHQRYIRENEELTRRLKKFVERLDNDKSDLFQQLLEEKRSVAHIIVLISLMVIFRWDAGVVICLGDADLHMSS